VLSDVCRCVSVVCKFMMMIRTDTRHILLSAIQNPMPFDLLLSIGMYGRKIASEKPPEMQRDETIMLHSMALLQTEVE